MKKWLIICGVCAALLAAAAVYVFRTVRLDTSGAVSAQPHIVHNYGWELKYDGDLIPHIYSYNYTLESGSEEFDALVELLSGVQLRRALRDTAPDYEPFEVDVRLYDAGGERVCEAGNAKPWVTARDYTLERGTPEFKAVAALLSGESCHRTLRYPDGTGGCSVTLWFYGGGEQLGGYLLMDSGFVRDMDNRDYAMGLFTGEPVRELTDAIAAAVQ